LLKSNVVVLHCVFYESLVLIFLTNQMLVKLRMSAFGVVSLGHIEARN